MRKLEEFEAQGLLKLEAYEKYIWMRQPANSDLKTPAVLEEFRKTLIREYDLIESDMHYDTVYGLPRKSLEKAKEYVKIPTVRTEVNGAITLNRIVKNEFNILTLAVLPDSVEEARKRLSKRRGKSQKKDENAEQRIDEDLKTLPLFSRVANFYIHNTAKHVNGKTGLETSADSTIKPLENLNLRTLP